MSMHAANTYVYTHTAGELLTHTLCKHVTRALKHTTRSCSANRRLRPEVCVPRGPQRATHQADTVYKVKRRRLAVADGSSRNSRIRDAAAGMRPCALRRACCVVSPPPASE